MAPLIDETNYYLDSPSSSAFERSESPSSFLKEHSGRQKKSVSFSVMSDLYLIPHAKDMKRKDKEAYWMSKKDFQRIGQENFYTVDAMAGGNFPISDKEYFRGLENLMPEARSKRKQRINFVVNAILKEQRTNRVLNDQWVEKFNKIYTSKSAEAAYNKGVWDATEATRTEEAECTPQVWI